MIEIGKRYEENLKRLEQIFGLAEHLFDFNPAHKYVLINNEVGETAFIKPVKSGFCWKCREQIDRDGIELSIFHREGITERETYFFHYWHYF